ncbi:MAG: hypothetical protein E7B29_14020, partial [Mixta calida]|nr:hypothetical protein [Mixta calida]
KGFYGDHGSLRSGEENASSCPAIVLPFFCASTPALFGMGLSCSLYRAFFSAPPAAFQPTVPHKPFPMLATFIQPATIELTGFTLPSSAY